MFSKTCEYAIRALIFIAQRSRDGHKVGIREVAEGINSSEFFIAKILHDLTKKELVQSQKGPSGGFYLNKQAFKTSIAEIVIAIDGNHIFSGCGLGLDQCSEKQPCPIHFKFKQLRKDLFQMLKSTRIGDFKEQLENNLAFLKRS